NTNAECGIKDQCGVRNKRQMRSAECGVRNKRRMRSAECQLWTLDFGLWTLDFGLLSECGMGRAGWVRSLALLCLNTLNLLQEEGSMPTTPIGRLDHVAFAVHNIDQART